MTKIRKTLSLLIFAATLASAGCASSPGHEGTGEYVDDAVISTKVRAAILDTPGLKIKDIDVETFKGIVQLSGFVGSRAEADKAVSVARGIGGVKSVKDDMRIR